MRTLLSITFLALISVTYGQKDPNAELYLNKISEDLAPDKAIHISFEYIREDLQDKTKIEGSGFLVLLDEKYRMELDEVIVYFDGEKQYSLNNEIEEVYISVPDPENKEFMFSDPIRLIRNYEEEFKYRLMGESKLMDKKVNEVQLYPEELGGPYSLLKLYFALDNDQLRAMTIRQKNGIVYTMIITELDKKEDPGIEYFRFSAEEFPNIDVIELLN
ncbi:MAG: outer membrane lipoprotein carrier protein LolA [Bacteroidales bacterium]|jgi:outer membrane lipoprotein-sorting protein|nr:outer membrane lipoprotein carrier protein LolA [Bacteroidales bacterium]